MRIFYVCADRGIRPGGTKGASVHFRSLTAALRAAGHEVTPFAARREPGVRVCRGAASLVEAALVAGPPDFICERYSLGATAGLAASRLLGVPLVLEVNAPLVEEARRHRPGSVGAGDRAAERKLFGAADAVVTVSEPLRRYVARIRRGDRGTHVLRNGCHPPRFRKRGRIDPGRLVFLGHPKPWHGAERLPRLLAGCVAAGHDARLVVVGSGPGTVSILEGADRLGVRDRVEITGPLDAHAAAAQLRRAAIGLAPYPPTEFFYFCPLKVIECMAAGLPVVTSRLGDLPAIVGDAGVLVPPGDEAAFTRAVCGLLEDRPRAASIGRRARRRAFRKLTWAETARRLVELGVAATTGMRA